MIKKYEIIKIIVCVLLMIILIITSYNSQQTITIKEEKQKIFFKLEVIPKIKPKEQSKKQSINQNLNVPFISQLPELPTGCEITSLTMVLNYLGFKVEKTWLVDNYLLYQTSDYQVGFKGSPYTVNGALMWPPAIVDVANNYLKDKKSKYKAHDVSGMEFKTLLGYLKKGTPIIMWVNETFSEYIYYDSVVDSYNEKNYYSYWGEHCIVLKGYDIKKKSVYINNPLTGESILYRDNLKKVYNICGKYAVVIYKDEE